MGWSEDAQQLGRTVLTKLIVSLVAPLLWPVVEPLLWAILKAVLTGGLAVAEVLQQNLLPAGSAQGSDLRGEAKATDAASTR